MPWHARLQLDYTHESGRSVARFRHDGPLRILQSLYPEGDTVCHNVLVHPPGGLVGGDTLDIGITAGAGSHGLITTPGASRFYRSEGELALQRTRIALAADSRLEWLPLEAICYSGCQAENRLSMEVAPGAELIGWDVTALGLPNANQPFERGSYLQHIEVPGTWLERGREQKLPGLREAEDGTRVMNLASIWQNSYLSWFGVPPAWKPREPFAEWWQRAKPAFADVRAMSVYRYTLPAESFEPLNDTDGLWVSREAVTPTAVDAITDIPRALEKAGVELRILPSLQTLQPLWSTSLHVSAIRMGNSGH